MQFYLKKIVFFVVDKNELHCTVKISRAYNLHYHEIGFKM